MKKFVLSTLGALGLSSMLSATEPMPFAEEKVKEPAKAAKKAEPIAPTVIINEEVQNQRSGGGFQFGAGIYYIKPFWESNTSITTTIAPPVGAVGGTTSTGTQDFDHNYSFAPRLFAGYVSECGLGIRLSWWRFEDDASASANLRASGVADPITTIAVPGLPIAPSNALLPGTSVIIGLNNKIEINMWDLDITQRLLDNDRWNLTVGGGVRYINLKQSYSGSAVTVGQPAGLVSSGSTVAKNDFDAVGPNILLDAKRRLGNGGLGLYATGRFGVLFGDSRQDNTTTIVTGTTAAPIFTTTTSTTDREDLIPFLDVEAGFEWKACGNGNLKPFARIGATGQNYFGVGNGSLTTTDTNLGFFGLTAQFGLSF